ncbi:hypothetical protein AB205_0052430, partial [Aquarana catesbeiana]
MPGCDSSSSISQVTIGCLSTGYLPAPVDVTWNSGSITTGITNLPGTLSRNGNYLSANFLTISTSDWKSNKYTCNVDHKATGVKINKDIPECTPPEAIPPTVKVLQGSCGETGSVALVCSISGYTPDDIKIQWLLNGQVTSIIPRNSTPYKDSEGKFESRSEVSVPKEDWNAGDSYTCRVNHPPSYSKNEDSIHKCSDLLITKEAKVTCIVAKLTSTDSTEFKWKREDGKRLQVFTSDPEEGFDGTYTVTSVLRLNVADWYSGKQFTCTVSHSDLPVPVEKTISYRDEDVREPTIYCFQPAPEELAVYDFVGLTCILKKFSHKDLYVQWQKNGVVIDENNYTNTEPVIDGDGETYIMYSTALISKSEWNRGATFTCSGVLKKITSKDIKKPR